MAFETQGKFLAERGGDLLVHIESPQKNLISGQLTGKAVTGTAAFAGKSIVGYPLLANNVPAIAGDEADVVAFVIYGKKWGAISAGASTAAIPPYTILNKFDGVVLNENALPTADIAGDDFTLADIKAAAGLAAVKWVAEPVKQTEQKGGTAAT